MGWFELRCKRIQLYGIFSKHLEKWIHLHWTREGWTNEREGPRRQCANNAEYNAAAEQG